MNRSRVWLWTGALLVGVPLAVSSLVAQSPPAASGQAQDAKPATGVIVGTVVDATSGKPIAGAAVTIGAIAPAVANNRAAALSGSDGRFLFTGLTEGAYSLNAQRGGYLPGAFGAIGPQRGGVLVDVHDGERRSDLVIKMWKPGAISGRVTDEAGEPLVGVTVQAWMRRQSRGASTGPWVAGRLSRTDDRGVYRISALPPDTYLIFTEQISASLPSVVLDEFQKATAANSSGGVGQSSPLMTEVFNSRASTQAPGTSTARMVGDQVETLSGSSTLAVSGPEGNAAYVSQFYPAAAVPAGATPVNLAAGQERAGIDLQLRPVKTVRVSGTIEGPNGPVAFTRVSLSPQYAAAEVTEAGTVTDGQGRFTMLRVPEGAHVLSVFAVPTIRNASNMVMTVIQNADGTTSTMSSSSSPAVVPPLPPDPSLYAELPITTADKDIAGLIVQAHPGPHIKGRIETPAGATATAAQLQRISVSLTRVDSTPRIGAFPRVRTDGSGEVTSQGFQPGPYTVNAFGAPAGWVLGAVMHGGVDVSQVPLDLTSDAEDLVISFTTTPTELTGAVRDTAGATVAGALVMIFPADAPLTDDSIRNPRRITRPIASTTGKYSVKNLPPGDYFVAAMAPDDPENASAPAGGRFTVESLTLLRTRASRVSLGTGEHRTLDIVTRSR